MQVVPNQWLKVLKVSLPGGKLPEQTLASWLSLVKAVAMSFPDGSPELRDC